VKIQIDDYELSLAEYRQAVRLHDKAGLEGWNYLFAFLAACFVILLTTWGGGGSTTMFVLTVVVGVLASAAALVRFVIYPLWVPSLYYRRGRQVGRGQLVLDEDGIFDKSKLGETHVKWEAVEGWQEDDRGIVLCLRGASWIYLPHAYLTLEQRRELRAW
jgi:hypothetical protein